MLTRTKARLKREFQWQLNQGLAKEIPQIMQIANVWPHALQKDGYTLPAYSDPPLNVGTGLPVPPPKFWADYCTSVDTYLQSGQDDTDTMRRLLGKSGAPIEQAGRILEVGCAGGRLIRWLADLAPVTEIWGTDLWASVVLWCHEHLSPPFHFATTTVLPHVPFEDRTFGLIYAGSVFTHIDDLAEAWFLELRRLLRPGGRLYFTINDRHAVEIFDGSGAPTNRARYIERVGGQAAWDRWVTRINSDPGYQRFRRGEASMVTMGRSIQANVLWDADFLIGRLSPGWRLCLIAPEAYGHQTGVLLERT